MSLPLVKSSSSSRTRNRISQIGFYPASDLANIHSTRMPVVLPCLLAAIAIAAPVVTFDKPAQEVTASIAGLCMQRGHTVVELTQSQVKCEVSLSNEQKGTLLFTKFFQRRYTDDVHRFIGFTVAPSPTGSIVQHRQWVEANINGTARTAVIEDQRTSGGIQASLVQLGGVVVS